MTDAFYKAEYYRALHAGNEGDAEYYAGMIPAPSDILELGCGAGRIALPLQAAGHRVIGVDSHRGLLDLANDAGLETIEADFTNLQLEKSFDHVILAYNGLFCLLSEEAVVRALGVARRHLKASGCLHLDVWFADPFHYDSPREDAAYEITESVGECSVDGVTLNVLEQSRWRPEEQRLDVAYLYFDGETLVHTGNIPQRYILKDELLRHLRTAGFGEAHLYGDFKKSPLNEDSGHMVVHARV